MQRRRWRCSRQGGAGAGGGLTGTFRTSVKFVDWLATAQRFLFIANFSPKLATERLAKLQPRLHIGKIQESSSRRNFAARIDPFRRDNPWKLLDKDAVHHEPAFQL